MTGDRVLVLDLKFLLLPLVCKLIQAYQDNFEEKFGNDLGLIIYIICQLAWMWVWYKFCLLFPKFLAFKMLENF